MPITKAVILPTKPPVYKRQQFLLELLQRLAGKVSATDLQKIVFHYLLNVEADTPYYEFVPYRFGPYSFQLAQDMEVLCKGGYINPDNSPATAESYSCGIQVDNSAIESLRGESLIRKTYEKYPFYAIRSEIAEKVLNKQVLETVRNVNELLENESRALFSIGYEGMSFEAFISILLLKGIKLLCDVRRNPISRKFGFSTGTLQRTLKNVGIQYLHIPELGIESERRQTLDTQDDYNKLFDDYRNSLPLRQDALNMVHSLFISNRRIALMCYEQDPSCCHRTIIKDYLVETYKLSSMDY